MPVRCSFFVLLLLLTLSFAAANPLQHIYENFQSKPTDFLFNLSIVLFLLIAGGILAGTTLRFLFLFNYFARFDHWANDS